MFCQGVALTWLCLLIYYVSCERVKLTCDQVKLFVDEHNWKRFDVASGKVDGQPPASNMQYLIWDDELAEKAARWAENIMFMHNPDRTIWSHRWNMVGENIYESERTSTDESKLVDVDLNEIITEAIDAWFNEHENYGFEPYHLVSQNPIGHYTQMVWATTDRVGCGVAQRKVCGETKTMIVCDYGPTGNWIGQRPYKTGKVGKGQLLCSHGGCKSPYGYYC